jgi:hypothetical protein
MWIVDFVIDSPRPFLVVLGRIKEQLWFCLLVVSMFPNEIEYFSKAKVLVEWIGRLPYWWYGKYFQIAEFDLLNAW